WRRSDWSRDHPPSCAATSRWRRSSAKALNCSVGFGDRLLVLAMRELQLLSPCACVSGAGVTVRRCVACVRRTVRNLWWCSLNANPLRTLHAPRTEEQQHSTRHHHAPGRVQPVLATALLMVSLLPAAGVRTSRHHSCGSITLAMQRGASGTQP